MFSLKRCFFFCAWFALLTLGAFSCVRGQLDIALIPSFEQKLDGVDLLSFNITGPALKSEPGKIDVNFADGKAALPNLVVDPNATDKWIKIEAFAYNDDKLVASGIARFNLQVQNGQSLRILLSRLDRFGWLTELEGGQRSLLPKGIVGHQVVPLQDGRVLIVGGTTQVREDKGFFWFGSPAHLRDKLVIYNPQSGQFSYGPALGVPRAFHTATLLKDGRVLIAGGFGHFNDGFAAVSSVEIFDPQSNKLRTDATPLQKGRAFHTATTMPDGTIVFVGGIARALDPNLSPTDRSGQEVLVVEAFDATGENVQTVATMKPDDGRFLHRAISFANNTVLITGGLRIDGSGVRQAQRNPLLLASGSRGWVLRNDLPGATDAKPRYDHAVAKVTSPDGKSEWAMVIGGRDTANKALTTIEIWDPSGNLISNTERLRQPRYGHRIANLPGQKVLVLGGIDEKRAGKLNSELLSYGTDGGFTLQHLGENSQILEKSGRYLPQLLLHPLDGRVMIFGGGSFHSDNIFVGLDTGEFFAPTPTTP